MAMLQVCVARLRERWPQARIAILTDAPALLERLAPGTEPVPAAGRYAWLRQPDATDRPTPERRLARRVAPPAARALLAFESRRRGRAGDGLNACVRALLDADLFLLSGRGGLTDAFADEAIAILEELALAHAVGVPTALLGQGIGPLGPELSRRAAAVLPTVGLIAVREPLVAPALLAQLGVPAERVVVTGDDAIELALHEPGRFAEQSRGTLALSLRVADYAGIGAVEATWIGATLRGLAERLGVKLAPLALSRHPAEADMAALSELAGEPVAAPADPATAIERIGAARTLVTGTYHAAVFALAQGIPTVCLTASPYYDAKFEGLRAQFGAGCEVIPALAPGADTRLAAAAERLWAAAPELAAPLRAAAARQAASGRAAYARLQAR
ncbi:MAG TPA: polysaccharide pyruvyl transferase family protein [Thermoleophilaceae bacterium]